MLAYALRRGASRADAEDVVVETFAICWRRSAEVPGPGLPWLLGVARRVLANQRRSRLRRVALTLRISQTEQIAVDPPPPDSLEENSIRDSLLAALNTLKDEERELLMLIGWEGLSQEEAASVLGCSRQTISKRLAKARQKLALQLGRSRT